MIPLIEMETAPPGVSRRRILRHGLASAFVLLLITLLFAAPVGAADVWDGTTANSFAGGDGSENNPYQISTGAQLAYLKYLVNNGYTNYANKYFKLTDDINLNGTNHQWEPIGIFGAYQSKFSSVFDGAGHTISNMNISTYEGTYFGLFGYVSSSATIKNLNVDGKIELASTQPLSRYVGGLAGYNEGGTIENCSSSVTITVDLPVRWSHSDKVRIGGIVGYNTGKIHLSHSTGDITTETTQQGSSGNTLLYVGGIVGHAGSSSTSSSIIANCYATGNITSTGEIGTGSIGGIVGHAKGASISSCYALSEKITTSGLTATTSVNRVVGYDESGNTFSHNYASSSMQVNGVSTVSEGSDGSSVNGLDTDVTAETSNLKELVYGTVAYIGSTHYSSLQDALAAANDGDVIEILGETISEAVSNDTVKSITIKGTEGTVLTGGLTLGSGSGTDGKSITIEGITFQNSPLKIYGYNEVNISGNTFTNVNAGTLAAITVDGLLSGSEVKIENNQITNTSDDGIHVTGFYNLTITGNTITKANSNAVTLVNGKSGGTVSITGNKLESWAQNSNHEGYALRLHFADAGASSTVGFTGNVMNRDDNAVESYVKITGPSSSGVYTELTAVKPDVSGNYWDGNDPSGTLGNSVPYYTLGADAGTADEIVDYCTDEGLTQNVGLGIAEVNGQQYFDLQSAVDAAEVTNNPVILLKDIEVTTGIIIEGSVTIKSAEGQQYSITNNRVTTGNEGAALVVNKDGLTLALENIKVIADHYAVRVLNQSTVTITNSEVIGYSALYFKPGSDGSQARVTGSTLTGLNTKSGSSDDFGTVVFEDSNITVNIESTSKVIANVTGTANQSIILISDYFNTPLKNNTVTVNGGELRFEGDTSKASFVYNNTSQGNENILITVKAGVTANFEIPAEYLDTDCELENSNGVWTVKAKTTSESGSASSYTGGSGGGSSGPSTPVVITSYTVTFYANGGTGEMESQNFSEGDTKALTANGFTREGYTFVGWAVTEGGEVVYADGEVITADKALTLYAVWIENEPETPENPETPQTPAPIAGVLLGGLAAGVILRRK